MNEIINKIEKEFVEKGADLEHTRWAKWQQYVFDKSKMKEVDGRMMICLPNEFYQRWARQIDTPYSELSEPEKESDRKETREYLPLVKQAIQTREREISEEVDKEFGTLTDFFGNDAKPRLKALINHQ